MNRLSKVVNVSKALGLTVFAIGVKAVTKVKSGVATSRDIYSECKAKVDQSPSKCSCFRKETISCEKHDPNGYYVGYTDEDMKRDNIKAGIGYSK
mgnify:CR=1 FL=1|jgi:hypothetical protein